METLIWIALLWVLWLSSSRRWRKRLVQPLAIVVIGYLLITSSLFVRLASWGLSYQLPADPGDRVDAIVILGRGPSLRFERADLAKELWEADRAPRIFISGMMDAQSTIEYLHELEVPATVLAGEECSQSTEENAQFTAALLRTEGIEKILLVTDLPHMQRSLLLFRGYGFDVIPQPVWVNFQYQENFQVLNLIVREYGALAYYTLTGRFGEQPLENREKLQADALQQISEWGCKVDTEGRS